MDTKVIERYIDGLMEKSTPEVPAWNVEKARAGKKSGWDYIDGCMLMALLELHETRGDARFLEFADGYEDARISGDGTIDGYDMDEWNLDNLNGGKNLVTLWRLTGKEKYLAALKRLREQAERQPRTAEGNFWHKKIYPNQVWLDGLYMAQPFRMECDVLFDGGKGKDDVYRQFFNVERLMRDKETGLYFHGYDSERKMFWADKTTGLSRSFWLRSLGWFSMAMLDTLAKDDDRTSGNWLHLREMFADLQWAMLRLQDESGMWFQVPDRPNEGENYLETSGTAIFAYSLMKGFRLQILDAPEMQGAGVRAFKGICRKYLGTEGGTLHLGGICLVAGLGPEGSPRRDGSFGYYMSEPVVSDDAKGVGPFILAYNEFNMIGN